MIGIRTGIGTDLHRLKPGIPLVIGGVVIPFDKGCDGHSDGDVLIHAICDALLGAMAMHDIGYHFSDKDPANKGLSSSIFLEYVVKLLAKNGWHLLNLDTTIHLEKPKLLPYIESIRESLAEIAGVETSIISVKAKTGEGIGSVGSGEAIEAYAVCLISK